MMNAFERHAAAYPGARSTYRPSTESPPAERRSSPAHAAFRGELCLVVAVVLSLDGARFTASATSGAELTEHVARYVRDNVEFQLWPAGAREVRALLDDGKLEPAIERYFALVGERWDREWLVVTAVDPPAERASGPTVARWIPADPEAA
jgi:hypothetical protein